MAAMATSGYETERLDHLGIVAGVCREIRLAAYLDALDERQRYRVERSFAELWQFPAPRSPLGTRLQRLPKRMRFRRHAAVCAPSDCPRVPDPVGVRRARSVYPAVYAARSVQPRWSTNGSWPHQRIRG